MHTKVFHWSRCCKVNNDVSLMPGYLYMEDPWNTFILIFARTCLHWTIISECMYWVIEWVCVKINVNTSNMLFDWWCTLTRLEARLIDRMSLYCHYWCAQHSEILTINWMYSKEVFPSYCMLYLWCKIYFFVFILWIHALLFYHISTTVLWRIRIDIISHDTSYTCIFLWMFLFNWQELARRQSAK